MRHLVGTPVHPPGILAQVGRRLRQDDADEEACPVAYYRLYRFLRQWIMATEHHDITLSETMHTEGLAIASQQLDYTLAEQPAVSLRD